VDEDEVERLADLAREALEQAAPNETLAGGGCC
jgi:hypothetical protein